MTHRATGVPQDHSGGPATSWAVSRPAPHPRRSSIPIEETVHGRQAPQRRGAEAW